MVGTPSAGARRRGRTIVTMLATAVVLLAVGPGCGRDEGPPTLDTSATERAIEKVIGGRIEPDVREVRCPDDIDRGEGRRFTCRAVLAGGHGEVRLRVRQTERDTNLDVDLLDAVIDRTAVADDLRRMLVKTFLRRFTVDCGDAEVDVAAPDSTFTCQAEDPAGSRKVTVTVVDAAGTLTYDIATE
ncbi:MAG: hypothetical protein JWM47_3680 [Acidimicrobiales bacterium]|nr:hypothetical protein [Acidimicrobiales bacterium]